MMKGLFKTEGYLLAVISLCVMSSCTSFFNKEIKTTCKGDKITGITADDVYDLSGYVASGGSSPFRLFDENDHFNPRIGLTSAPFTNPQPTKAADIFFPFNKGNRIVVDLRVPYKLSEIYLYDQSAQSDTIWIYTGSMAKWKLQSTIVTKGDPIGWGWRRLALQDSTQFVMISFRLPTASVNEVILYGCPTATPPPRQSTKYSGPRLPKKSLKDFLGVNMYNSIPLEWLEPFSEVRMYTIANTFDLDTINPYPNNKISISRYGYLYQQTSFRHFSDDLVENGKRIWYSVRGVPVWMNNRGLWDFDRPVTKLGMDTEDPMSYGRHSNMMWTLAAVFGKTKVDTNELQISDMIKVSGKGTMTKYENGNEEDAGWVGNKYCTPMEYFAQSSADYDGHMGKLGPKHGVHVADSNSELIMSGLVEFDTNRVRILNFLCKELRPDKKFLWQGGIQYHHYSNKPRGRKLWERNRTMSTTPEEDSLRVRLAKVREHAYRLQPKVECILGEYGYDKGQASRQATPILPGYSASQSQGILLLRGINATAFSGFDKMMIYWMKDDVEENNPNTYLTSGLVRDEQNGKFSPYPGWFYLATLIRHLGNYIPDDIVSERSDVWVYRYRHQTSPDSIAYFVYCPTRIGKKVRGFAMEMLPGFSTATEIEFVDQSKVGNSKLIPVKNGRLQLNVSEVPKLIICAK